MIQAVVLLALLQDESALQRLEREVQQVLDKVRPSVVQVTSVFSLEAGQPVEELTFSGVVYSKDGHVVTAASGVEQASEIRVVAAGGRTARARHVASDRRSGVAVLRIDLAGLVPAALAEEPARPGCTAIAVGNALGGRGTAAVGSVTACGLSVVLKGKRYDDLLQVSSPVQPGDGGAFVADAAGRLIGLVQAGAEPQTETLPRGSLLPLFDKSERDVKGAAGGTGFAVAASWVRFSADRIIKHGRMVRGWIGLSARARADGGPGVEVLRVEHDGPARRAGLAAKDVVLEFDGEAVKDVDGLRWKVAQAESPRKATALILRDGERRSLELDVAIDPQR